MKSVVKVLLICLLVIGISWTVIDEVQDHGFLLGVGISLLWFVILMAFFAVIDWAFDR